MNTYKFKYKSTIIEVNAKIARQAWPTAIFKAKLLYGKDNFRSEELKLVDRIVASERSDKT